MQVSGTVNKNPECFLPIRLGRVPRSRPQGPSASSRKTPCPVEIRPLRIAGDKHLALLFQGYQTSQRLDEYGVPGTSMPFSDGKLHRACQSLSSSTPIFATESPAELREPPARAAKDHITCEYPSGHSSAVLAELFTASYALVCHCRALAQILGALMWATCR
jgi:hypothetical protein